MASAQPRFEQTVVQARAEFDDIESCLGELAAMLSDVADALTCDPETLSEVQGSPWPDLPALLKLKAAWVERRDALVAAWRELDPKSRASHPLPPFGAVGPTRPVV